MTPMQEIAFKAVDYIIKKKTADGIAPANASQKEVHALVEKSLCRELDELTRQGILGRSENINKTPLYTISKKK